MKNKEYLRLKATLASMVPAGGAYGMNADAWARNASLLGVVAVGMALAQLTWRLFPLPAVGYGTGAEAIHTSENRSTVSLSVTELTERHLFGSSLVQPGGAINAPETTLNLTLRGIFAIDNDRALAIIASGGGNEQPYKVGDSLPGGARVHEIDTDKVILERGGRFETLTLPKESSSGGDGGVPGLANAPAAAGVPMSRLGEIRNRLRANPAEVVRMNAIHPVMENGHLKGYQLTDNPYMPVLRQAGLMPGDVVTRVNGIPVTDPAKAAEVLNQLSTAGRVDLEVERGGAVTSLSVSLGK